MSQKQNVPTFQIYCQGISEVLEGPIVSYDKRAAAQDFEQIHQFLRQDGAILVYSSQWQYIPAPSINRILRGKHRFSLPWPLIHESQGEQ